MAHVFGSMMHGNTPADVAALAERMKDMGVADVGLRDDMDIGAGIGFMPEVDMMMMARASSAIKVMTLTGREIQIDDIDFDDSVAAIKERVEQMVGIPPEQQRLILAGKQLADKKSARACNLQPGCVVHLVLALRGGDSEQDIF